MSLESYDMQMDMLREGEVTYLCLVSLMSYPFPSELPLLLRGMYSPTQAEEQRQDKCKIFSII